MLMPEDLETTIVLCSTEVFLAERWLSFILLQFEKLSFLRGCQDASLKHFILPGSFTVQKQKNKCDLRDFSSLMLLIFLVCFPEIL